MVFAPAIFQCIYFFITLPAEPIVKQQLLQGSVFREFGGRGSRVVRDREKKIKDRKERLKSSDKEERLKSKKGCNKVTGN